MELVVRIGEREERLTVTRAGGRYRVRVGDTVYDVDRAVVGPSVRSLLVDGRQVEVALHRQEDGVYWVSAGQSAGQVEVVDPLTFLAREAKGQVGPGGPETVTAYMPGRVVDILVEEGDKVAAGQGVLVLEAMKMENEIDAERAGVVTKILVEAGQPVEGGDPLFELE